MPAITIVLPTYNRLPRLKRVLAALEQQTLPTEQFDVVVVSDGSTDGSNEYLKQYQGSLNLTPILKENGGVATARNAGYQNAKSDLVLFIDDDVIPEPDLIEHHLRQHQIHGQDVVIIGPMLTPPDFDMAPWVLWEQAMLEKQYEAMTQGLWEPTARQFYTGNTSLARQHLVDANGFDPSFRRAEDVELAYRLDAKGIRFVFDSQAIGYHYADRSFSSWINIPYAYGRNDVIFCRDKGQTWLLPIMYREFEERNQLIQFLVKGALDRPALQNVLVHLFKGSGRLFHTLNIKKLAQISYSAIFNMRYFQGVADEIGGRGLFLTYPTVEDLSPNTHSKPGQAA